MSRDILSFSNQFTNLCSVQSCENTAKRQGFCKKHFERYRLYNDVFCVRGISGESKEARFWARVDKTSDPNGCWVWTKYIRPNGYAAANWNGKVIYVHRLSWFFHAGKMPTLVILHMCDNRKCVNPSHLKEGTQKENMEDAVRKNRQAKGEQMNKGVLSESDIIAIKQRLAEGIYQYEIAKEFNTTQSNISHIKRGLIWKHI